MKACANCVHIDVCRMNYRQKCELTYDTEEEVNEAMRRVEKESNICEYYLDCAQFINLPCKIGDTCYIIDKDYFPACVCSEPFVPNMITATITGVSFKGLNRKYEIHLISDCMGYTGVDFSVDDINKLFFSRDEAVKAWEKLPILRWQPSPRR